MWCWNIAKLTLLNPHVVLTQSSRWVVHCSALPGLVQSLTVLKMLTTAAHPKQWAHCVERKIIFIKNKIRRDVMGGGSPGLNLLQHCRHEEQHRQQQAQWQRHSHFSTCKQTHTLSDRHTPCYSSLLYSVPPEVLWQTQLNSMLPLLLVRPVSVIQSVHHRMLLYSTC